MQNPEQARFSILAKHQAKLDQWLRARNVSECDVEDLRQETYRRALQYLKEREMPEAVLGLLLVIARGVVSEYIKARRKALSAPPELVEEDLSPSDPERELNEQEIRQNLDELLGACSDETRKLLLARFEEEKTFEQIAEERHVSTSTAYLLYTKAIKDLVHELREKRQMERFGLVPFADQTISCPNGAPSEPGAAPRAAPTSDRPVARNAPNEAANTARKAWPYALLLAATIPTFALLVSTRSPPKPPEAAPALAAAVLGPVATAGGGSTSPAPKTAPVGVVGPQGSCVCPEPVLAASAAPSPPPQQKSGGQGEPKSSSKNRDIYHAFERAYRAGDCKTAKYFRSLLTGAFAEAVSKWPPCKPAE